jgi:cyclase
MKRGIALAVLMLAGVVTLLAARQADQPKTIQVTKLKDNLYVLKGGGGNTSVFIMSNGVTVVDTKNPGWGQPILDQIKKLTDKPVVRIINTHTHGDHVSGNVEFPATVDIVVQENTKTNMMAMRTPTGITTPAPNVFKDHPGVGMPKHTFKDKMTIGKGPDEVQLYYFGRGHTNGDAWVWFPAIKVLHAADIFSGKNLPLLDANNGGSGVAIGDSLQKAYDTVKDADVIVTGHSGEMTRDDLKQYAEFNREFLADMRAAKKAGKSVDAEASEWKLPAKYTGYTIAPDRLKINVQVLYDEIK